MGQWLAAPGWSSPPWSQLPLRSVRGGAPQALAHPLPYCKGIGLYPVFLTGGGLRQPALKIPARKEQRDFPAPRGHALAGETGASGLCSHTPAGCWRGGRGSYTNQGRGPLWASPLVCLKVFAGLFQKAVGAMAAGGGRPSPTEPAGEKGAEPHGLTAPWRGTPLGGGSGGW